MRKNAALLVAVLFCLAGCFSASPDKKYYEIHLETGPAAEPFAASILIDRIDIDSLYDDFRIIYRVSPFEINYYAYHFWADKPSKLFRDSIIHYLEAARLFPRIIPEPARGSADWVLRCTIHQIEEVDAPAAWFARLSMRLEIAELKSGTILASRRFDRQEPLSKKDVAEVPAVLSRILSEELGTLLAEVRGK